MFSLQLELCILSIYVYVGLYNCEESKIVVNKCCEPNEIFLGDHCTKVNKTNQWKPSFVSENDDKDMEVNYTLVKLVTGYPDCGHLERRAVYQYENGIERLTLFPSGVLRHYYEHHGTFYHDYEPGKYCLDKKLYDSNTSAFAWICTPNVNGDWMSTEFLMHNVISPVTHSITIICLLIVAIIYFVMPTLCDLTGNIITTICMCLIISQTADMIRLLTVFKSHVSLLITEAICYISMLAAFFWLNSLGYYIWKTFRSRNVFLRITDGKKYCYYCGFAWSCTLILGTLAMFAHFTMDYPEMDDAPISSYEGQEQIGSLGTIIFFAPVALTVLADAFFFATTLQRINRMHTYGRIHHKLRHSFRMFLLLLLVMTLCWIFFLSSFSQYDGLINAHIIVNALEGPLIMYICICNQRHVPYLMRKTCCYDNCIFSCCRPEREGEWGDEMTAMNTELNY